ncbi:hypothetical protein F4776DRAFT_650594 [Hypoxylon sp. NC0597]|nr:hypothetical protein F4776DRAFT_650594 [Hypoxylon sp. NC0597]
MCLQTKYILNINNGFKTATDYLVLLVPICAVSNPQMEIETSADGPGVHLLSMIYPTRRLAYVQVLCGNTKPMIAKMGGKISFHYRIGVTWKQIDALFLGAGGLASRNLFLRKAHGRSTPHFPTTLELKGRNEYENGVIVP